MPVRVNAGYQLASRILNDQPWWSDTKWNSTWMDAEDVGDAIFVDVVNVVDWQRVLIEASVIHLTRSETHQKSEVVEGICGKCVRDALLNVERLINADVPEIPEPTVSDWAVEVGRLLLERKK